MIKQRVFLDKKLDPVTDENHKTCVKKILESDKKIADHGSVDIQYFDLPLPVFKNVQQAIAEWVEQNLITVLSLTHPSDGILLPLLRNKDDFEFFMKSQLWRNLFQAHTGQFKDQERPFLYIVLFWFISLLLGLRTNVGLMKIFFNNIRNNKKETYPVRFNKWILYVNKVFDKPLDVDKEIELYLPFIKRTILPITNKVPSAQLALFTQYMLTRALVIPEFATKEDLNNFKASLEKNLVVYLNPTSQKALSMTQSELSGLFTSFSKDLIDYYTSNQEGKNVSIRLLRYVETKSSEKKETEEYKEWSQHLSQNKSETGSKSTAETSLMMLCRPQKTHDVAEKIERKLLCEDINMGYKSINTLYLREADKQKLFGAIDRFKNKKDLLKTLGLPYKLGVLLYGLPGCGKSSTILSIASYLQKDIFYIDLKTVKTNTELKEIFDQVYKVNANGGIIAFEDIDCATPVVLKRSEQFEAIEEKDGLTLDFLLNLLQGTLTRDGTIFIATTNYIDRLDEAFVRDGRFDVKIEMKMCNNEQIKQICKVFFNQQPPEEMMKRFAEYCYSCATILNHFSDYLTSGEEIDWKSLFRPFSKKN